MSIDCRTRLHRDRRTLSRDEVFDDLFPEALERNAALAARGLCYKGLPSLGLTVEEKTLTLREQDGRLTLHDGALQDGAASRVRRRQADCAPASCRCSRPLRCPRRCEFGPCCAVAPAWAL